MEGETSTTTNEGETSTTPEPKKRCRLTIDDKDYETKIDIKLTIADAKYINFVLDQHNKHRNTILRCSKSYYHIKKENKVAKRNDYNAIRRNFLELKLPISS